MLNSSTVEAREQRVAPPLALQGIVKHWGKNPVLTGCDLVVQPGRIAWVGGRNGAGKTTLLRIAAGLIAADAGEVRLDGLDPESDRRDYQRRLGFLPAGNGGLYARLTARRNLEFWSRIAFVPPGERQSAVDRAIERFELEELAEQRVDRMSMGQRQRVRLAMTFLHGPYVALLDEPHTSLDTEGLALLQAALESVCDAGGAAVWCSPAGLDGLGFDDAYTVVGGRLEPA